MGGPAWSVLRNRRNYAVSHKFYDFSLAAPMLSCLFRVVAAVDAYGGPVRFLTQQFLNRCCPRFAQSVHNRETAPKADILP